MVVLEVAAGILLAQTIRAALGVAVARLMMRRFYERAVLPLPWQFLSILTRPWR